MSIWVRSQNKGALVNANYFFMDAGNRVYGDIAGNSDPNDCGFFLGEYASEEVAMAVLDEIQEFIAKGQRQSEKYCDGRTIFSEVVFQMPEAGFLGGAADARP